MTRILRQSGESFRSSTSCPWTGLPPRHHCPCQSNTWCRPHGGGRRPPRQAPSPPNTTAFCPGLRQGQGPSFPAMSARAPALPGLPSWPHKHMILLPQGEGRANPKVAMYWKLTSLQRQRTNKPASQPVSQLAKHPAIPQFIYLGIPHSSRLVSLTLPKRAPSPPV